MRASKEEAVMNVPVIFSIPGVHDYGIRYLRIEYFTDCKLHTIALAISLLLLGVSLVRLLENDVSILICRRKKIGWKRGCWSFVANVGYMLVLKK